eukprot:Tbor_TRINITY_DN5966_c3_g4::TRINITY_DN5966_c3_g4_i3::g.18358::m.18358
MSPSDPKPSLAQKALSFIRNYTITVFSYYIQFIIPIIMISTISIACDSHYRDSERIGLLWLRYNNNNNINNNNTDEIPRTVIEAIMATPKHHVIICGRNNR